MPQVHGPMKLVKRHRTIYFRAENLNVAEQEVGNKEPFCRSRCDAAESMTTAGVPARDTCPDRLR